MDNVGYGGNTMDEEYQGQQQLNLHHQHQDHQQTTCKTTTTTKSNIRYAERRRSSTCRFADRVARVSVDLYRSLILESDRPPQTCIATIVAHYSGTDGTECTHGSSVSSISRSRGELRVISLGVGTKFLPESMLRSEITSRHGNIDNSEQQEEKVDVAAKEEEDRRRFLPYGCRVRDLHAEILARRAFRRYLTTEILNDLSCDKDNSSRKSDDGRDADRPLSILVRSTIPTKPGDDKVRHRYTLRPGVTLHLYTSSAPCGNATLKRFCKMTKEKFRDDLDEDEWPDQKSTSSSHEPFFGHSIKLGEFSLLIKKDNSIFKKDNVNDNVKSHPSNSSNANEVDRDQEILGSLYSSNGNKRPRSIHSGVDEDVIIQEETTSPSNQQHPESRKINCRSCNTNTRRGREAKVWPADLDDDWTPPGTTIVPFRHNGSIHTCSDKILRWNVFGLQGSLLSSLLDGPLYLSTLTVGRKLSGAVCRRAVCCRLGSGPLFSTRKTKSCIDGGWTSDRHCPLGAVYHLNHPSIMGTAVYVDETGVVETNSEIHGQDVRFHSSSSWVWWDGVTDNSSGSLECIDGSTGFLMEENDTERSKFDNGTGRVSLVSTQELVKLFLKTSMSSTTVDEEDGRLNNLEAFAFSTLSELHLLKKCVSPKHEEVKEYIFKNDRVLYQWRRRVDS